jgi:hypothetical protein
MVSRNLRRSIVLRDEDLPREHLPRHCQPPRAWMHITQVLQDSAGFDNRVPGEALRAGSEALRAGSEALRAGSEALRAGSEALRADLDEGFGFG